MALTVHAYAKLNLTLEVLGERPDGYHEIASVMQTISLADTLTVEKAPELTLRCSLPDLQGEDNLVLRAAHLVREASGRAHGAHLTLTKRIPPASGLGGGSSDAATTLWALDQLWGLGLQFEELQALAGKLGADVPFFLIGGTALATGRGDHLAPAPVPFQRWFLIVRPPLDIPNKTATMYSLVQQHQWTHGIASQQLARALWRGTPLRETFFQNVFDSVAPRAYPVIAAWQRRLRELTPAKPHITGTGPAFYIPIPSQSEGEALTERLGQEGAEVYVVHTVPHSRAVEDAEDSP